MKKLELIFVKICCMCILLLSIVYIPMNVYWHSQNPGLGFELNIKTIILSMVIVSSFFIIGWMFLLKTNNPLTRYNPFSLNPKWDGKMNGSMEENPGQIFELDSPDENEIKRVKRNKNIENILK